MFKKNLLAIIIVSLSTTSMFGMEEDGSPYIPNLGESNLSLRDVINYAAQPENNPSDTLAIQPIESAPEAPQISIAPVTTTFTESVEELYGPNSSTPAQMSAEDQEKMAQKMFAWERIHQQIKDKYAERNPTTIDFSRITGEVLFYSGDKGETYSADYPMMTENNTLWNFSLSATRQINGTYSTRLYNGDMFDKGIPVANPEGVFNFLARAYHYQEIQAKSGNI